VLRRYRRLIATHKVDEILAVATSAVREARNGEEYLRRVRAETGIRPRLISGAEEAELIWLAALHSIHLQDQRALVIDIGGGSLELALGGSRLERVASEKLGSLRLSERFVGSDPLSARDEARLVAHVQAALGPHLSELREAGFDCAVGTSGTILALGALAAEMETGRLPEQLHHVSVRADTLRALRRRLVGLDLRARQRLPGVDQRRADMLVAGAIVLDHVLSGVGASRLTLCEWALREGLLLQYIHGNRRSLAQAAAYPDVRRRSVMDLVERCRVNAKHAGHVARLALLLFDATRKRHRLDASGRALLEYAALMHGAGRLISHEDADQHTYYLVTHGDLRGFTPPEIEVMACVARHHRRGRPRRKDAGYGSLRRRERRRVRVLAGLLRLADALDRTHRQVVSGLAAVDRPGLLRLRIEARGEAEIELWGAQRRVGLLERALDVALRVEAAAPSAALGIRHAG
jgi:exopolyphosphatase/guanosine-5'-triphosphate,3'-diphosphate pyrophosphatase